MMATLPARGAGNAFHDVAESALQNGLDAQLPPHLSLVLGIGSGDLPVAVKQAVIRDGYVVRVFDVAVSDHKNIVLLRTNEQDQTTKAWLLSADGKLRKAVSYRAGGEPKLMPARQGGAEAATEIRFWTGLRRPTA